MTDENEKIEQSFDEILAQDEIIQLKRKLEYYQTQEKQIEDYIKKLKEEERFYWCRERNLTGEFVNAISHFKRRYNDMLNAYGAFVEHILVSLRALHMIAKSGYGMTHRQRNARLDVLCDTIEEAVKFIINEKSNGIDSYIETPFTRKDWDTRRLAAENHHLRRTIEEMKKKQDEQGD